MVLSDLSVKRPVFATVISLLLIAFGVLSIERLTVREFPDIDPPIVSVSTIYRGASASTVETQVTEVIEDQISGIQGIRWIESESEDGRSRIVIEFRLDRDIDVAANDVRDRVSRVIDQLPDEVDAPEIFKVDSDSNPIVWFNMQSSEMDSVQLTDYADRYLVDRLSVIDGVARVRIGGMQRYAMRIWLDRIGLAARGLTVTDIERALRAENVELPAGALESAARDFTLRVARSYKSEEDFRELVVAKGSDGHLIRLGEVATVEFTSEEPRIFFHGNGEPQVGLGIVKQSKANTLEVAEAAQAEIEEIRKALPDGTVIKDSYNSAIFIRASIDQVYRTLGIAMALVIAVIYLFLGSARATLIPAITVPVSLVASFTVLFLFGYSINLLTLLALVLSIGLVVDDSIVVLENIHRRIQMGEPPLLAAYNGARQVGFAVVATTIVLVAVFVPIIFLEGNVGRLFAELGVAVASAVTFSTILALTLAPMLASKLLKSEGASGGQLPASVDKAFDKASGVYQRLLSQALDRPAIMGAGVIAVVAAIFLIGREVPSELAPAEDRGNFFTSIQGPTGAGFDYTVEQVMKLEEILLDYVDNGEAQRVLLRVPGSFSAVNSFDSGFGIFVLSHWDDRERSTAEIVAEIRTRTAEIPGVNVFVMMRPGLGGGFARRPLNFVIGASTYEALAKYRDIVFAKVRENPGLVGFDGDYKETRPQMEVTIDRNRAADLGVSVEVIGRTLETMVGARDVTTFIHDGEEYDVILQGRRADRQEPNDLSNIYVRSSRGDELIPLSNLVSLREFADADSLDRFNRTRAVTFFSNLAPGYSLGEALTFMENIVATELPSGVQVGYKGQSLEFKESGSAIYFTFVLALLIVFLVLAAQFESFIHPFVIMLSVPLALLGAVFGLWVGDNSFNVYSQVGIIILVGIAAKNGILIVEFANQLRDAGRTVREAILEASQIRLRPIVMTGLSTTFGAVPLVVASGAGAESRATIGIVIVGGVFITTLLTLFVVPVFYNLFAPYTRSPKAVENELELLRAPTE